MTPLSQAKVAARLREALPNARDLSEAFPAIPPGRLIRCANPSSTSEVDSEYLLGQLRVRDLIDLRAEEELLEDDPGSRLMARTVMQSYRRGWLWPGLIPVVPKPAVGPPTASTAAPASSSPSEPAAPKASAPGPAATTTDPSSSTAKPAPASAGLAAADAPTAVANAAADPDADTSAGSSSGDPADDAAQPQLPLRSWGTAASSPATSAPASAAAPAQVPVAAAAQGAPSAVITAVRHNISLLDRGRYYLSLASRIPVSVTAVALATNFFNKPAARAMLLPYVNAGGLAMLYEMLLESSQPEIKQVMEILLRAAEARHCVMFFCRAGKDRTGLVAALVLSVAGASEEEVVEDYARSDEYHRVALAGLESREELAGLDRAQFERAPPEVMRATLEYVRRRYGSFAGYLTSIGFGPDKQQRLRELLTSPW